MQSDVNQVLFEPTPEPWRRLPWSTMLLVAEELTDHLSSFDMGCWRQELWLRIDYLWAAGLA